AGDVQVLRERGDPAQKYLGELAQALARQDYAEAGRLAQPEPVSQSGPDRLPDWAMLEAGALYQAAEKAYADEEAASEGEPRAQQRRRREELARRAVQALRRGLDADPNHVGLLFLKANSFQRRAWEAGENDDRDAALRRHRPAFETACDRL